MASRCFCVAIRFDLLSSRLRCSTGSSHCKLQKGNWRDQAYYRVFLLFKVITTCLWKQFDINIILPPASNPLWNVVRDAAFGGSPRLGCLPPGDKRHQSDLLSCNLFLKLFVIFNINDPLQTEALWYLRTHGLLTTRFSVKQNTAYINKRYRFCSG